MQTDPHAQKQTPSGKMGAYASPPSIALALDSIFPEGVWLTNMWVSFHIVQWLVSPNPSFKLIHYASTVAAVWLSAVQVKSGCGHAKKNHTLPHRLFLPTPRKNPGIGILGFQNTMLIFLVEIYYMHLQLSSKWKEEGNLRSPFELNTALIHS